MLTKSGESGQSVVVGAMLLLGLLVVFISWYQLTQIPVQNQNAEAEFHENVRLSMLEFKDKGYSSINNGETNQIEVNNKVEYPQWRLAGLQDNVGSIVFEDLGDNPVSFQGEEPTATGLTDNVSSIQYRTSYDEKEESTFVFEYGSIFELNPDGEDSIQGSQEFIRGDRIYLFGFSADFRVIQSENPSFVIVPDEAFQEQSISGETDEEGNTFDIELEFRTDVDFELWERLLINEDNVVDMYESGEDSVVVVLDGGETYDVYTGSANIVL